MRKNKKQIYQEKRELQFVQNVILYNLKFQNETSNPDNSNY